MRENLKTSVVLKSFADDLSKRIKIMDDLMVLIFHFDYVSHNGGWNRYIQVSRGENCIQIPIDSRWIKREIILI